MEPGARPQRWKLGLVLMFAAGKGSVKPILRALGKQQTEFRIQWLLREGMLLMEEVADQVPPV